MSPHSPQDDADQRESDHSESEDEDIVVTREEEQVDPEDEAEFEREYARIMAESLESRKFDRKPMFDVALPVRAKARETSMTTADNGDGGDAEQQTPSGTPTMSFSLLTKRGNRQQTRTLELPSDSDFAVAMRSQQQAEREEQQRIKNLVLNLDLRESEDLDGDYIHTTSPARNQNSVVYRTDSGHEKPTSYFHNRPDKTGKDRSQRVRKLQLSDVDWYGPPPSSVRRGDHGYEKRGP